MQTTNMYVLLAEGILQVAKRMKGSNMTLENIVQLTGLDLNTIDEL